MSTPTSHIVPFGILALSTQLHCFQLSYDGVAKMESGVGSWRRRMSPRLPAWPRCPWAVASLLSWALPGRAAGTCARPSPAEMQIWVWHCPGFALCSVLSKVTRGCEHAEGFLCQAGMSHQRDSPQVGGCLFQELQTIPWVRNVGGIGMGPL